MNAKRRTMLEWAHICPPCPRSLARRGYLNSTVMPLVRDDARAVVRLHLRMGHSVRVEHVGWRYFVYVNDGRTRG